MLNKEKGKMSGKFVPAKILASPAGDRARTRPVLLPADGADAPSLLPQVGVALLPVGPIFPSLEMTIKIGVFTVHCINRAFELIPLVFSRDSAALLLKRCLRVG